MIEHDNLQDLEDKLHNTCDANGLVYAFYRKRYPVQLVVRPDATLDTQMTLIEDGQAPGPKESELRFTFREGKVLYKTSGGLELPESIFNKIKNLAKKMHYAWLQVFFLDACQKASGEKMAYATDDSDDQFHAEFSGSEDFEEMSVDEDLDAEDVPAESETPEE